ncbi:MAG: ATP-binding protein [Thermodesulfobacteriota bacterium]|nr:ATP-binding protein [Thermodesulfobacteriota bacterium]
MDLEKYEKIFAQESEKYLVVLDDLLARVEKDLANRDLWSEIHGKIHSIKGMAVSLSLDKISKLSHSMESWCKEFQQGTAKATPNAVRLLFDGMELLGRLIARKGDIDSLEIQAWYERLSSRFKHDVRASKNGPKSEKPLHTSAISKPEKINHVRVNYSLIEELLGLSQEIMLLEKNFPPFSDEEISLGLRNYIDHYTSMLKGLYFRLAQLRLMSVDDFAGLFVKTIRSLAREHNKDVQFDVLGGEVQADIGLLESLREPFVHLLRNCIIHGIETQDERVERGKNAQGIIRLEAASEGNNLLIKISDDGRGISRPAIIKYLKEKKAGTDEDINRMSAEDFFNTILSTDFSSVSEATDMAGRGIGMKVVSRAIDHLGGSLIISSSASKGTEFAIKIPLSLSVIYTVTFKIGKYILSIPTLNIQNIDRMEDVSQMDMNDFCDLRGLFGVKNNGGKFYHVLKLKGPEEKSGDKKRDGKKLIVDNIIGNNQLMVMPAGELLAKAGIFAGVGIMENGDVSVLLDTDKLADL